MSELTYIEGSTVATAFLAFIIGLIVAAFLAIPFIITAYHLIFHPQKSTRPLLHTLDALTRSSKLPETRLSDFCKSEYPGQDTDLFLKS
jgi:hypothetical protein